MLQPQEGRGKREEGEREIEIRGRRGRTRRVGTADEPRWSGERERKRSRGREQGAEPWEQIGIFFVGSVGKGNEKPEYIFGGLAPEQKPHNTEKKPMKTKEE